MKVQVGEREGCKVRVNVEVTADEFMDALAKGLPPFLAAMGMAISPETDLDQALRTIATDDSDEELNRVKLDCAVGYLMPRAVEQAGLLPACNPSIMGAQHEADGRVTFGVEVYPNPEVGLSSYEPVRIAEREPPTVTEEEIDQQITAMAMRGAVTQPDIITGKPKKVPARIDDEWVRKNVNGCTTVKQLRESLRAAGERFKNEEIERRRQDDAIVELASRMEGDIADELVDAVAAGMIGELVNQLASQGMTIQEFVVKEKVTLDQLREDARRRAKSNLIHGAVLDAYFAHEGLQLQDGDVEAALSVIAPTMEKEALKALEDNGFMFTVKATARRLRATRAIMEAATAK